MGDTVEFVEFTKIARLNRDIVVTEKIDGTNASVHILRPDDNSVVGPWVRLVVAELKRAASPREGQ